MQKRPDPHAEELLLTEEMEANSLPLQLGGWSLGRQTRLGRAPYPRGESLTDAVRRRRGMQAVNTLENVVGPDRPLLIVAKTLEGIASVLGWAAGDLPTGASTGMRAAINLRNHLSPPRPSVRPRIIPRRPVTASVPTSPSPRQDSVKNVRMIGKPGLSGVSFLPVRDAYDRARKGGAGAPMAVFWREPDTQVCQFSVMPAPAMNELKQDFFRYDSVSPHGDGFLLTSYEDGKLGSADGPAVRTLGENGEDIAPAIFCLDGSAMSAAQHELGREAPVPATALASGVLSYAEGGHGEVDLPGGSTVCSTAGMENEFSRAESFLNSWLSSNEPRLRGEDRSDATADALIRVNHAIAVISEARKHLAAIRAAGVESLDIDFSQFPSSAAGFATGISDSLLEIRSDMDNAMIADASSELTAGMAQIAAPAG
jgi:hypothetical protein